MRHAALTASPAIATDWYAAPEAQALLADIAANPPALKRTLAPLAQFFAGGREFVMRFDPNDSRVDDLRIMSNAAFCDAERACGDTRAVADVWAGLDDVVRAAVEGAGA